MRQEDTEGGGAGTAEDGLAAAGDGARLARDAGHGGEMATEARARAREGDRRGIGLHAEGLGDLAGLQPVHLAQQQRRALRGRHLT